MRAALISLIIIIIASLAGIYRWVGVAYIFETPAYRPAAPHIPGKTNLDLSRINVLGVYFVPKNRSGSAYPEWKSVLEANLAKLKEFHEFSFLGRSELAITVLPLPIIGREDSHFYDNGEIAHDYPDALGSIYDELRQRVLTQSGDHFQEALAHSSPNVYTVFAVMYEGVGASGMSSIALLSRAFLTESEYAGVSATFLAHEFYHALGVADGYTIVANTFSDGQRTTAEMLASRDIMGLVRKPLDRSYLERDTLRAFGL